jgi:hypothetical protein
VWISLIFDTSHFNLFCLAHTPAADAAFQTYTESKEWVEGRRMTFVSGNISSQCAGDKPEPGLKQYRFGCRRTGGGTALGRKGVVVTR